MEKNVKINISNSEEIKEIIEEIMNSILKILRDAMTTDYGRGFIEGVAFGIQMKKEPSREDSKD